MSEASISNQNTDAKEEMEVDFSSGQPLSTVLWTPGQLKEVDVPVSSDGILLYVGEAAYESGESPLSVWIPRRVYEGSVYNTDTETDGMDRVGNRSICIEQSPLDTFERSGFTLFPMNLSKRRLTYAFTLKISASTVKLEEKW